MKEITGPIFIRVFVCTLTIFLTGSGYADTIIKESSGNRVPGRKTQRENHRSLGGAKIPGSLNQVNMNLTTIGENEPQIIHNISQVEKCLFCLIKDNNKCIFKELRNVSIKVVEFDFVFLDSGQYAFFKVRPTWTSLLVPFIKYQYRLGINQRALKAGIPLDALQGALSHELVHLVSYEKGGFTEIMKAGWVEMVKGRFEELHEKEIDQEVIRRKMGRELIAFRLWLYKQLDPQNLARKKKVYLTPEQIAAQMQLYANSEHVIEP